MSPADLVFLRPWWFLALLPAGLVLWRLGRGPGPEGGAWSRVVDAHLAPHVLVGAPPRWRRAGLALLGAAFAAAILALAGPGLRGAEEGGLRRDLVRVLVVDLSPAMAARDMATSRLEQAKLKILDLLRALPAGQTALLVYGGEPYLVVPPSTDRETIALFVPELAVDAVPVAGNRPEKALAMAGEVLARSGARDREILWVTAGAGALPPEVAKGARLSILHAAPGEDKAFAAAAGRLGATYVQMRADDADVRRLAEAVSGSSAWTADAHRGEVAAADRGYWLLLAILPLGALAFRRGLLGLVAAPLLLAGFLAPGPAEAAEASPSGWLADYRAWQRFQAGDAAGAAEAFSDRRWRAAASYRAGRFDQAAALLEGERDADSLYNRGNALARLGRLAEALAAYEESLALREDVDARYNRDLVERLLKEKKNPGGGGKGGPPPAPPPGGRADAEKEAARLADRWLGQVPDEPGSLLRRKLQAEQRRRTAGEGGRP